MRTLALWQVMSRLDAGGVSPLKFHIGKRRCLYMWAQDAGAVLGAIEGGHPRELCAASLVTRCLLIFLAGCSS